MRVCRKSSCRSSLSVKDRKAKKIRLTVGFLLEISGGR